MPSKLLLIFLGTAALLFFARRSSAAIAPDTREDIQPVTADPSYWFLQDQLNIEAVNMGSPENNLAAFLALIRKFETNDKYNVLYGGKTFSDYSWHPNIAMTINLPGYEGKHSTAAGAYQFLYSTWENLAAKLELTDFTPPSQDAAAIELLSQIGAMSAIQSGDFDAALRKASTQWASLPYSPAKQNPKSIAAANEFLARYLA